MAIWFGAEVAWAHDVASGLPFSHRGTRRRAPASPTKAAEEDGFSSLINEPDLAGWDGNRHAWKLDDGVLTGRSDGSLPAILVVSSREFGDFELRFEARVNRGAVRVKMRGPGPGLWAWLLRLTSKGWSGSPTARPLLWPRPTIRVNGTSIVWLSWEVGLRFGKTAECLWVHFRCGPVGCTTEGLDSA